MPKDVLLTDSTPKIHEKEEIPPSIARQIIEEAPTIEEEGQEGDPL